MSDPRPVERQGIAGQAIDASRAILGSLQPEFLVLVLLNIAFLALVMWFLTAQIEQRTAIVSRVIDVCVAQIAK